MGTRSQASTKVTANISGTARNAMAFDSNIIASVGVAVSKTFNFNSGADETQCNRSWQYGGTITSAASITIDLTTFSGYDAGAGDGLDLLGQSLSSLDDIVAIIITNENAVADGGYLEIEPGATNGWTAIGSHTVSNGGALPANGVLLKATADLPGFVISATLKTIKLTASGADVVYKIAILAREDEESSSSVTSSSSSSSTSSSSSLSSSSSNSSKSSSSSSGTSSSSSSSVTSSSSLSSQTSSSSSSSVTSSSSSSSVTSSSSSLMA